VKHPRTASGRSIAGFPGDRNIDHSGRSLHDRVDHWFYRRSWIQTEVPGVASIDSARWVIFMDRTGLGKQISAQLRGAAHRVIEVNPGNSFTRLGKGQYLIRPGSRTDYDALVADILKRGGPPQKIVHLWSVTNGSSQASLVETLNSSFYSLLHLAQALGARKLSGIDIAVISNHLQSVSGEPTTGPARATLLGPTKAIPKLFPGITCRSIDCDPIGQGTSYVALQIITEHCAPFNSPVVAYRSDERWIETLERMEFRGHAKRGRLKREGVYLITGALGDLGLAVAEHLARDFQARLVLVDRAPFPPPGEWQEELQNSGTPERRKQVIRKLLQIRSLGSEVIVICADVAQSDEIKQAVEHARQKFGNISGVVHAASSAEEKPFQSNMRESAASLLNQRIKGTLLLEDVLGAASLDFLALFSSAGSLDPSAGQIDSAAEGAFFDAFATSRPDARAVAIHWGLWRKVSQNRNTNVELRNSVGASSMASDQEDWIESEDAFGITPRLGAAAFARLLSSDTPPTVVVSPENPLEKTPTAKPTLERGAPKLTSREVEAALIAWWQRLLSVDRASLDDDFFELGGDSLLGSRLFGNIKKRYGLNLGLATLFEARTIRQLAQRILQASGSSHDCPRPWSPLVPIQPKGALPPVYVISGLSGNVIKFHSLAFHLGEDQPMYGLLPRGLDGKDSYHARIEDMAADYVEAIRTMQPEGPYHLVGYSFGGIVAFEVAQQITAQRGQVGVLGLFDATEWHYMNKVQGSLGLSKRLKQWGEHLEAILLSEDRVGYTKVLVGEKSSKIKSRLFPTKGRPLSRKIGSIEENNSYAAESYHPKVYPGKLTLFRCTKREVHQGDDPFMGWGEFAGGGTEVYPVPSTHFTILKGAGAKVLADNLRSCLKRESSQS
jgi:thioesterase domain-containing protein/NAD(P)-dependent dehydrogenase (short-subunit alcohol dehydrogenase family)